MSKLWWERENQQDATIRCLLSTLSQHVSGIIMHIIRRIRPCVTACGVLRWFWWMWLVAVVGRCVVGCEQCWMWLVVVVGRCVVGCEQCWMWLVVVVGRCVPHPAEPTQHTACSNTQSLFSWRWAYWCPKHVETVLIINIWLLHLVVFLSLSLQNLVTMHGHRNLKLNQLDAQNLFHNKFYFMPLHVSSTCARNM